MGYLEQFHYEILGGPSDKKLVFLHGLLGFSSNWRRISRDFVSEFEILIYDQRGHGKSFKPKVGYRPEDFSTDLLEIINELGWEKIFLVGHSLGGRNALNFAFRFPERVEKLVIEDIAPNGSTEAVEKFERMFASIPTPFANKVEAKQFLMNDFSDPKMGSFLYSNIEETASGKYDWKFSRKAIMEAVIEGRSRDRWEEVVELKVPTLLIRGGESEDLTPANFEKMLLLNPLIQGRVIAGSGHWVHFDKPEEFSAAIRTFFANNS